MADAVRREMRRAGWGAKRSESRVEGVAAGRELDCGFSAKRTERCGCCGAESTDDDRKRGRASSKLGVRLRLYAALPDELDARE